MTEDISMEELRVVKKTSQLVDLYKQAGLTLEDAVHRAVDELTPEEFDVFSAMVSRNNQETQRIRDNYQKGGSLD